MPTFPNLTPYEKVRSILNANGMRKNNLPGTRAPGKGDDILGGWEVGSLWIYNNVAYICTDASSDNAKWTSVLGGAGGTQLDDIANGLGDMEEFVEHLRSQIELSMARIDAAEEEANRAAANAQIALDEHLNAMAYLDGERQKLNDEIGLIDTELADAKKSLETDVEAARQLALDNLNIAKEYTDTSVISESATLKTEMQQLAARISQITATPTGNNILLNPDFSNGNAEWSGNGTVTNGQMTVGSGGIWQIRNIALSPGEIAQWRIDYRGDSGRIITRFQDSNGNWLGNAVTTNLPQATSMKIASGQHTPPANAARFSFRVETVGLVVDNAAVTTIDQQIMARIQTLEIAQTDDKKALAVLQEEVSSKFGDVESEIKANAEAIRNTYTKAAADNAIVASNTTLRASLEGPDGPITAAQQAAQAAADAAGSKGKVFFQSTTPSTSERLAQNLWIDTTNGANTPKRWNGSAWVAVTDKVATDAAAAAAAAASKANQIDATLTNDYLTKVDTNSAISAAITKLDSKYFTNDGQVRATALNNYYTKTTANQAIAASTMNLKATLEGSDGSITAAQQAAQAAADVAGAKGRVFFQSTAPASSERLTQNLWIDTANGANTPKRWNGSAWVAVTDKVATDAAAAAAAAQEKANQVSATLTNDYLTKVSTQQAISTGIQSYDASLGGLKANVTNTSTALADLRGSMAGFKFLAQSGSANAAGISAVSMTRNGNDTVTTTSSLVLHGDNVIAPGTLSTSALVVGLGKNLLIDPSFEDGDAHWGFTTNNGAAGKVRNSGSIWAHPAWPTLEIYQPNSNGAGYSDYRHRPIVSANAQGVGIPAKSNTTYIASVYLSSHRCECGVYIVFFDKDGNFLEAKQSNVADVGLSWPRIPDEWTRVSVVAIAPVNTCFASVWVRKYGTKPNESDSYLFIWKPQIEETHGQASQPSAWSPGGTTYINGGRLFANSITTRELAANSVTSQQITVESLDAISANLGTIKAGRANIAEAAVDTLRIAGNSVGFSNFITAASNSVTLRFYLTGPSGESYDAFILGSMTISYGGTLTLQVDGVTRWVETPIAGTLASRGYCLSLPVGLHTIQLSHTNSSNTNGASIFITGYRR